MADPDSAPTPGAADVPRTGRSYDPAYDPDRYWPDGTGPSGVRLGPPEPERAAVPLDPARDPDRFTPAGDDDQTPGWYWLLGLVAVFGFLGLTAWVLVTVGPR